MLASGPAFAQSCTTDASGNTLCDPTSFHVGGTTQTGSDPVVIQESNEFSITKIDGGAGIDPPLTVIFAIPFGVNDPIVTADNFDGGPKAAFAGGITSLGLWIPSAPGAPQDLYTFAGCAKCDNSLNVANLEGEEAKIGLSTTIFGVFEISINQGFAAQNDVEDVFGTFANGTIIAPLAEDIVTKNGKTTTTFYDTSWTNTGFVNAAAVGSVPEPRTWAMLALGFGLLGFLGMRRKREARLAL